MSFESDFDGLVTKWEEKTLSILIFDPWLEKAIDELEKGRLSVFLIPARPQTKYWHELIFPNASEIRFIKSGVQFKGYLKKLLIPICIVRRYDGCSIAGNYEMYNIEFD